MLASHAQTCQTNFTREVPGLKKAAPQVLESYVFSPCASRQRVFAEMFYLVGGFIGDNRAV